jgi:hypothetical protein
VVVVVVVVVVLRSRYGVLTKEELTEFETKISLAMMYRSV